MTKPNQVPSAPNSVSNNPREAQAAATRKGTKQVLTPFSPFPQAIYGVLALSAVISVTSLVWDKAETAANYDNRDLDTIVEEGLHARRIVTPEETGDVTKEKKDRLKKQSICIRELMGFLPTDKPMPGVSQEIWEENNETRGNSEGDYIQVYFPDKKETRRYSYHENLHDYAYDKRWTDQANTMWQMSRTSDWKRSLGWIMESYLEKYPEQERNEYDKETWIKHINEVYFSQPLECPRWEDGSCMKTYEGLTLEDVQEFKKAMKEKDMETVKTIRSKGRDCLLVRPAARTVTWANRAMFNDGKGEIYPMTCYRNVPNQSVLTMGINGGKCELIANPEGDVQNPGESNHGPGRGMDVANRAEAYPYLSLVGGWQCAFVGARLGRVGQLTGEGGGTDFDHCSIGEWGVSDVSKFHKKRIEAPVLGKGLPDIIKKGWDNRGLLR